MRTRLNVYFPPELLRQLIDLADRKRLSRSSIVEAAVTSFLSPDGADRTEAAFARRLDRMSRQIQRLERDVSITTETLACSFGSGLRSRRNSRQTRRWRPKPGEGSDLRVSWKLWADAWRRDARCCTTFPETLIRFELSAMMAPASMHPHLRATRSRERPVMVMSWSESSKFSIT